MARDAACGANNKAVCDRNASKDQKAAINQHGCSIETLPALDGALRALDVAGMHFQHFCTGASLLIITITPQKARLLLQHHHNYHA